jgi:hypothetical protein
MYAVARVRHAFAPGGRGWLLEWGIFALALLAYQASRALVIGDAATAHANAAAVIGLERALGLSVEGAVQGAAIGHDELLRLFDRVYLVAHWTVTPAFFIWLYMARRRWYPMVRNGFLVANGIALLVFMAFPVAPPRMVSGLGLVDTLHEVSGVDLHGGTLSGWFNPYAAVPSMHMGYAALIGVVTFMLARAPWLRILAVAYPVLVFLTITVTANHFVIDALAGIAVMGLGSAVVAAWAHLHRPARERGREGGLVPGSA